MKWRDLISGKPSVFGNVCKLIAVVALTMGGIVLFGRAIVLLLPFFFALAFATLLDKPVTFLKSRLHIHRTVSATIAALLLAFGIGTVLVVLAVRLYVEARELVVQLPQLYNNFVSFVESFFEYIESEYEWITPDILQELRNIFTRLRSSLLTLVNSLTRGVWNTATSAPQAFIGFVVLLFTTFFLLRDKDRILAWWGEQLPPSWSSNLRRTRRDLFHSLFAYFRAILILAVIAFIELLIGLTILRVDYAIVIAFLCAVLDAIPAIGPGWVLTPWGIISLLMGDYRMGVGLLLLYGVVFLARQLLEPRIVGDQVGMYPPVLLLAMYLGLKLWGVFGLLLGPISAIILRNFLRMYFAGRTLREVVNAGVEPAAEPIETAPEELVPAPGEPQEDAEPEEKEENV